MANWERKSAYLLREIVKFRTYIDCLQAAQAQKEKIYSERTTAKEKKEEAPIKQTSSAYDGTEATTPEKKPEADEEEEKKTYVNFSEAGPVDVHA